MTLIVGITIVTDITITNINNTNIIVLITVAAIARNASISPHTPDATHTQHHTRAQSQMHDTSPMFCVGCGLDQTLEAPTAQPDTGDGCGGLQPTRYGR